VKPDSLPASDRLEFAQKKIAAIIGGSWMPGFFAGQKSADIENMIGFIPLFPVPSLDEQSSTLMGGWELGIPITSDQKALSWELIEAILEPDTLGPWIQQHGYLPTQIPLGQGLILNQSAAELPYYDTLISMIPFGNIRPSMPEYPIIAGHINEAIDQVYSSNSTKSSIGTILNEAAIKSAHALGW
jgi:multiple sugar transport system substrate-binding protein